MSKKVIFRVLGRTGCGYYGHHLAHHDFYDDGTLIIHLKPQHNLRRRWRASPTLEIDVTDNVDTYIFALPQAFQDAYRAYLDKLIVEE